MGGNNKKTKKKKTTIIQKKGQQLACGLYGQRETTAYFKIKIAHFIGWFARSSHLLMWTGKGHQTPRTSMTPGSHQGLEDA